MPKSAQNYETPLDQVNQLQFLIRQLLIDVHTSLPCRVLASYPLPPGDAKANDDGIMGLVDVELMIDQLDNDDKRIETRPIYNVPYHRLQAGKCAIVLDPVKGDRGWLSFGERDISTFKKTREKSLPASNRMLSQSDGHYIPGLLNDPPEIYIRIHPEKGVAINCGGKAFKLENCSGVEIDTFGSVTTTASGSITDKCGSRKVDATMSVSGDVNCANVKTGSVNCSSINVGGEGGGGGSGEGGGCSINGDGTMSCSSMSCEGEMSCGSMSCTGNSTCSGNTTCGGDMSCDGNSSCGGDLSCGGGISCGDGLKSEAGIFTAAKDFVIDGIGKLSDLLGAKQ